MRPSWLLSRMFLALLVALAPLAAQEGRVLPYESHLLGPDEEPIHEGAVPMTFVLLDEEQRELWREEHLRVEVRGGHFEVLLGAEAPIDVPFERIRYLGIRVGDERGLRVRPFHPDGPPLGLEPPHIEGEPALMEHEMEMEGVSQRMALAGPGRDLRVQEGLPLEPYEKYIRRSVPDTTYAAANQPILSVANLGNGNGLTGRAVFGSAVSGRSQQNSGVYGRTDVPGGERAGVYGYSDAGTGVTGRSGSYNGIKAISRSDEHAALACGNEGAGPAIYAAGGSRGVAAIFSGHVEIRSQKTGGTVIELGEGLDYAEGFDINASAPIEPGSVLVIDPETPGRLTVSTRPYDRAVAGVVAGANGQGSGVRLGSAGHDGDVALAGRVYCRVEASHGAVEPGDLLTTSGLAGWAMKATDPTRAQGAVLGKAMERLPEGERGLILILVTLQ